MRAVYLYGSLAWGKHFTGRSDIDLLVEGFPREANYWRPLVEEGIQFVGLRFRVRIMKKVRVFPALF